MLQFLQQLGSQKALDLVVNNPTGPLFDPNAQKIVAIGLVVFLLCWGVAKILGVMWKGD